MHVYNFANRGVLYNNLPLIFDLPTLSLRISPAGNAQIFQCSDKSRFKLLAWRGDKISGSTFAADTLLPDLHVRHRLDKKDVEYLVECKYRSSWGEDGIDLSSQYMRYHFAAKDSGKELFIALGVGGSPSDPEEFLLIPGRMVKLDKKIDRERFIKCACPKTPDGFHDYINHYFNKRVFKNI